jgi:hypothetical protein
MVLPGMHNNPQGLMEIQPKCIDRREHHRKQSKGHLRKLSKGHHRKPSKGVTESTAQGIHRKHSQQTS